MCPKVEKNLGRPYTKIGSLNACFNGTHLKLRYKVANGLNHFELVNARSKIMTYTRPMKPQIRRFVIFLFIFQYFS